MYPLQKTSKTTNNICKLSKMDKFMIFMCSSLTLTIAYFRTYHNHTFSATLFEQHALWLYWVMLMLVYSSHQYQVHPSLCIFDFLALFLHMACFMWQLSVHTSMSLEVQYEFNLNMKSTHIQVKLHVSRIENTNVS